MNIEIDQQQKFKENWDGEISFINPTRTKFIPSFNGNSIDILTVELRDKFEILRNKYFAKSL